MLLLEVVKPSPASTSEDVGALAAQVTTGILALYLAPKHALLRGTKNSLTAETLESSGMMYACCDKLADRW